MACINIEHVNTRWLAGSQREICIQPSRPPFPNRPLVRCRIVDPVLCSWVLTGCTAALCAATASAILNGVYRKNLPAKVSHIPQRPFENLISRFWRWARRRTSATLSSLTTGAGSISHRSSEPLASTWWHSLSLSGTLRVQTFKYHLTAPPVSGAFYF